MTSCRSTRRLPVNMLVSRFCCVGLVARWNLTSAQALESTPRSPTKPLPENGNKQKLKLDSKIPVTKVISSASPSTILNAASSLLPAFLHSSATSSEPADTDAAKANPKEPEPIPPNPLESSAAAHELFRAQKISDYVKDHKATRSRTSSTSSMNSGRSKLGVGAGGANGFGDRADAHLPRVAFGEGDGPEVEYRDGSSDCFLPGCFVLIIAHRCGARRNGLSCQLVGSSRSQPPRGRARRC
jgi:hypothetical protein